MYIHGVGHVTPFTGGVPSLQKIAYSKSKSDVIAKMDGTFTERKRKKAEEGVSSFVGSYVDAYCAHWLFLCSMDCSTSYVTECSVPFY